MLPPRNGYMKYGWSRLPSTRLVGPAREPRGGTPLRGFPFMFGQLRETDAQGHTPPVSSREERMADNEAASREFNEEIERIVYENDRFVVVVKRQGIPAQVAIEEKPPG